MNQNLHFHRHIPSTRSQQRGRQRETQHELRTTFCGDSCSMMVRIEGPSVRPSKSTSTTLHATGMSYAPATRPNPSTCIQRRFLRYSCIVTGEQTNLQGGVHPWASRWPWWASPLRRAACHSSTPRRPFPRPHRHHRSATAYRPRTMSHIPAHTPTRQTNASPRCYQRCSECARGRYLHGFLGGGRCPIGQVEDFAIFVPHRLFLVVRIHQMTGTRLCLCHIMPVRQRPMVSCVSRASRTSAPPKPPRVLLSSLSHHTPSPTALIPILGGHDDGGGGCSQEGVGQNRIIFIGVRGIQQHPLTLLLCLRIAIRFQHRRVSGER